MKLSNDYILTVNNIKNKILNLNFNFSDSEIIIIKLEKELLSLVAETLSGDYSNWQTVSISFCDKLFNDEFNEYLNEKLIVNYYKKMIDAESLNNSFDESGMLSDGSISQLENYFKTKLKDNAYKLSVYCLPASLLKIIVDEGRFDILNSIKSISNIYDETLEKIRNNYLKTNNPVAPVLIQYLNKLNLPIDHFNLSQYLEMYNYHEFSAENFDELLNKINSEKDLLSIKTNWINIFSKLNDEQKNTLATVLLDKKHFHPVILNNISINGDNYENIVNKVVDAIGNGIIVNRYFMHDFDFIYNHNQVLQDDRIIEALIKNGYLSIAVQIPNFKKYEKLTIELVNSNPEKYKNIDFTNSRKLNEYQDLLLELIKIGNESALWLSNGIDKSSIFIKEEALKGNVNDIPYFLMSNVEFLNQMICDGFIDIVFSKINKIKLPADVRLTEQAEQIIIEHAENSLEFAVYLVSEHASLIINSDTLLKFFLQINDKLVEILLNKIYHVEEKHFNCSEDVFYVVKEYLVKKYNLNSEHFEQCKNNFGPSIIKFIINDNIQKFINLPDEQFNALVKLFPRLEIDMVDIEKIYDSLKQYEFSKKFPDVVSIFANINHSLSDNDNKYLVYINDLLTVMDEKFYKKIDESYPGISNIIKDNPQSFMLVCINNIKNGAIVEKEKYLEILHTITNYYIAYKREDYRNTYDIFNDLSLPYNLDEKDIEKQYINHYLLNSCRDIIVERLSFKGYDSELISDCIDYYQLGKRNFSEERLSQIKKLIKDLIFEAKKLVQVTGISNNLIEIMDSHDLIKRKYYVKTNTKDTFSILSNLRLDVLTKILENENAYNTLLKYMEKYKLHVFPDYFKEFMKSKDIDISLEAIEISGFISYFGEIYEMEKKRLLALGKDETDINLSIVPIIKYAEAYSAVSSIYNQFLGSEDARYVKANPTPNSAVKHTNGNERLDLAINCTLKNFERTEITVPAFNEIVKFNSDDKKTKKMRVVVGNFTHPSNITHGERTGACMRIGGVGETLFDFCLEDKNGFHIRFEDADTGEYISRVSGFRNGNSVFLNELRYSCNLDLFSNEDVVNACKEVASMLVQKSLDSSCPIDNVFLHDAYATSGMNLEKHSLNITNNKEGLKRFYSDIGTKAIVLASNKVPFEVVDFDKSSVPVYSLAREVIYQSSDNNKIRNMINRVHAVKQALNGVAPEYVDGVNFDEGLYYGMANQDWYVYIDNLGNVHEELINIDARALEELEEAKKQLLELSQTYNQTASGLKVG